MQKSVLYPRQQQILNFIESYMQKNKTAPSLKTIKEYLGIKTLSTVHEHIAKLEAKGFIYKTHDKFGIHYNLPYETQSDSIYLSLKGTIAAGEPILAIEDYDTQIAIPKYLISKKLNPIYALKVKGDSMIDALIANNDIVIIEQTQNVENGDTIVALLPDNCVTLKKFYKKELTIHLRAANDKYKDIIVKEMLIQGKVIAVYRKY